MLSLASTYTMVGWASEFVNIEKEYDTLFCRRLFAGSLSDEDLGLRVGARAGDEGLRRVEGHVVDALVEFLAVRGDLLHASASLQVPQPNAAIVACKRSVMVRFCGSYGENLSLPDIR